MSENFIAPNTKSLAQIVHDATNSGEDIGAAFERMKAELRGAMGIVNPPSENEVLYGGSSMPAQSVAPPAPAAEQKCIRVVYPWKNSRFEIYGVSEEDLDRQEAAIRALYQ